MKRTLRIGMLLSVLLLLVVGACAVRADVTIDMSKTGSITVKMKKSTQRSDWKGLEYSLYRIGDVLNEQGGLEYEPSGSFASLQVDLNYSSSEEAKAAAATVQNYINQNKIQPLQTEAAAADGTTVFSNLPVGVYFGCLSKGEYVEVTPFIIPIPNYDEKTKSLNYDPEV
ncbi:MAG: hypothetical protein Q4B09_09785, partial [Lachnospiraceae bacterium]|nr:hypothetical protein [Lachnospiraceae bacterium]